MLTRKQRELLTFINVRIGETGVSPSFDEMRDAPGLRSKSGVHRLVSGLEERGFIRRLAHKARALEVIRLPETAALDNHKSHQKHPAQRTKPLSASAVTNFKGHAVQLPLHGQIAAGTPIEALRDPNNFVDVPSNMIGRGQYYALTVSGASMEGDGIIDGDIVVIEEGLQFENNDIVVALVRNEEATLKRIEAHNNRIILRASNLDFPPQEYAPQDVSVQGRLVGLVRKY
jgi:repressor LexA